MNGVIRLIFVFIFILLVHTEGFGQHGKNDTIRIPYNNTPIEIDGDLSEWETCFRLDFKDTAKQIYTTSQYALCDLYPILSQKSV